MRRKVKPFDIEVLYEKVLFRQPKESHFPSMGRIIKNKRGTGHYRELRNGSLLLSGNF